jgi:peroxiredoxin
VGERERPRLTVVGLSISSPYEHKTHIEEREMDYRLFSDPANDVAEEYDIVNDLDGMAGISEPRPAVYLLDEDRTVEYAWVASEWPDFPDYDEIEDAVADL